MTANDEYQNNMAKAYSEAFGRKDYIFPEGKAKADTKGIDEKEINRIKNEANTEVKDILDALEKDYPGITEGVATLFGAGIGGAGSFAALSMLGVSGLSAPGITSGLAAAGSLIGGGMVAGIGVLAAPIAALGVAGYALAKKHKNAKLAAALGQAISKLYDIQSRLIANAELFKEEIAGIKVAIEMLTKKQPG